MSNITDAMIEAACVAQAEQNAPNWGAKNWSTRSTDIKDATRRHVRVILEAALAVVSLDAYVVELRHKSGNYVVETDIDRASLDQTVKGLMDGQFFQPAKVYKLVDVTKDFQERLHQEINRSENGQIPEHLDWFMAP